MIILQRTFANPVNRAIKNKMVEGIGAKNLKLWGDPYSKEEAKRIGRTLLNPVSEGDPLAVRAQIAAEGGDKMRRLKGLMKLKRRHSL